MIGVSALGTRVAGLRCVAAEFDWSKLFRRLALALGLPVVLLLVLPPARIESQTLETLLAQRLGFPVRVGSAAWRLSPWPILEVHDAVAFPEVPGHWPIGLSAERVLCRGMSPWRANERPDGEEIALSGLDLRYGPVGVRDAQLVVRHDTAGLRIEGRARGTWGGSVKVVGTLGIDELAPEPLRIYLSHFEVPPPHRLLPVPWDWGTTRISGVVTVTGGSKAGHRVELDLTTATRRAEGPGDWLETTIQGDALFRDGRLQPGPPLRVRASVRELGGGKEMHALHGDVDLAVELLGSLAAGLLTVEADLAGLRVRSGRWLEKPAGVAASLHYERSWSPGARGREQAILRLGALELSLEPVAREEGAGWRMRSKAVPLGELHRHVPAVRALPAALTGTLDLDGLWHPERGLTAQVAVRHARAESESFSIAVPSARLELAPDRFHLRAATVRLGDQNLELEGSLQRLAASGREKITLSIRARALNLVPVAELAALFWGDEEPIVTWEDLAREVVLTVRSYPGLLERIELEPAILTLGRLYGLGVAIPDARYRLTLVDQMLKIRTLGTCTPDPCPRYAVDLSRWLPKLTSVP